MELNKIGFPPKLPVRTKRDPRQLRARFDNAQTTDENSKWWAGADALSPNSLAAPGILQTLRNRARYECRNNSWAKGVKDTLANDCIGTGPRLQLLTDNEDLNKRVEMDFWAWSQEIRLAEKLRTMRASRVDSGEVFGLIATNPMIVSDVKIDVTLIEAEQVADPYLFPRDESMEDGIQYDTYGNPVAYNVLQHHPGATGIWPSAPNAGDRWPAQFVLHYYRPDRPGQRRGLPDITPALDQFMELRRYSKAVIAAAETAADFAAVAYTDAPAPEDEETEEPETMDQIPIARRMMLTMPHQWKMEQFKAEQPTDTYKDFVNCKLGEIGRCLQVPFFITALDSATTNMSAAYVVGQKYAKTIEVDRSDIEYLLNRLVDLFLTEWLLINDRRRSLEALPDRFNRVWQWDEVADHADPAKRANAQAVKLAAGVTNIPREYARVGLDFEDEQIAAAKSWGVPVSVLQKSQFYKTFGVFPDGTLPAAPAPEEPTTSTQESPDDKEEVEAE